jgi:hypothetical protein
MSTFKNAKEFTASLDDWVKVEVKGELTDIKVALVLDTLRVMSLATPVGNPSIWKSLQIGYKAPGSEYARKTPGKPPKGYVGGTARRSWFITDFRPSETTEVSSDGGISALPSIKNSSIIWVSNNLPYIERIMEHGWSTQAPKGTFSAAFMRLKAKWGIK